MKPYYESNGVTLFLGDCREVMPTLDPVYAVICDPPYGLEFMGKEWDAPWKTDRRQNFDGTLQDQRENPYGRSKVRNGTGASYGADARIMQEFQKYCETWAIECLRVLRPGGHLLSFGGSRTYHRMACAIEDAGFEIRDQIMWLYGSGFPKSLDVSKAIDKAARGVPQGGADPTSENHGNYKGGCSEDNPSGRGFGAGPGQFMKDGRKIIGISNRGSGASPQKLNNHEHGDTGIGILDGSGKTFYITEPATEAAKQWEGYGTALKPAHEPICVARKPLEGTVAANVLKHGTGALNIDGCRVGNQERPVMVRTETIVSASSMSGVSTGATPNGEITTLGRWPANIIHDGSDEVVSMFPDATGQQGFVGEKNGDRPSINTYGDFGPRPDTFPRGDSGSAARFFYTAKASQDERGTGNNHPTVKPLDLMRYLCKMLCPPSGGILLDPFMGSGSTIIAGRRFYQHCIGIELEEKYAEIAAKRLSQEVLDFGGVE